VATTNTNIFGPLAANLVGLDKMAERYASKRVTDYVQPGVFLNEGMPTEARVLGCVRPSRNNVYAMTQNPAAITNSFPEFATAYIGVVENLEEKRVSTPFADILVVGIAPGNADIVMPSQEAGQRMRNPGDRAALIKNRIATADAKCASFTGDFRVVNLMTKEQTSR
jgi:hypothetical protein